MVQDAFAPTGGNSDTDVTSAPMLLLLKRVVSHDVFRHGLLVLSATVLLNIGAFLFHAVVSRKLGVAAYGSLYALVSLVQLASLPAGVFTTVISKFAAEFCALNDSAHMRALTVAVCKIFSAGLLVYVLAGFLLALPIAGFLHVPAWAIIVASAMAGCVVFVFALRAIIQGTQDFGNFSISLVMDGGLKGTLGAVLAAAKFGLIGGVVGFFLGTILSGLYVAWRLWTQYSQTADTEFRVDWRRVFFTTMGAAALTASTAILSFADVLVVKHFFAPHEAGIYAAASLAGKILFFLVGFAPMVLIPKAADSHSRGEKSSGALKGALLMVVTLSAVGFLGFLLGGSIILRLLVGAQFSAATSILPWYGLAMALLGITNVVASYSIALHRFTFGAPLVCIALAEIAAIYLYHPALQSVVSILVAGNAVALAAVSLTLAFGNTATRRK